ncbi:PREDICTED: dirigent protein 22-like [Fragaria vesca subsp. vesca]|uniref:dirigent protein 22-like n=1 Tax=Fragaria vesca subsp. vesca TaxID=101020 RepID=UPI0002C36F7E|nr:PREDICTED: dirigent protein 22-like [Fragaria vesca subsp. vesca]
MALAISPLLILVLSTTVLAMASTHHEFKETKMSMYMHDFTAGPNITDIPVAGIAGKLWVFNQFGTIYVNDDSLTEGPSRNSTAVGRAQGFAVTASLDGRNALSLISFVFTNKKYNGSTIEVQGCYKQYERSTEVPVVSGTGKFRFARGYVIFETYFFDIPSGYSIIRCNITVQHY